MWLLLALCSWRGLELTYVNAAKRETNEVTQKQLNKSMSKCRGIPKLWKMNTIKTLKENYYVLL